MSNDKTSRHGAESKKDCEKMAQKYGWDLKASEKTNRKDLSYDCIFDGDTEFPKTFGGNKDDDN
jgi:hypothetical protein